MYRKSPRTIGNRRKRSETIRNHRTPSNKPWKPSEASKRESKRVEEKANKNNDFIHYSEWKKTVLTTKATIKDVLKNINKSGSRISLIVDSKKECQNFFRWLFKIELSPSKDSILKIHL